MILMDVDNETYQVFPIPEGNQQSRYMKMGNYLSSIINQGAKGFQISKFDTKLGSWTFYHQIRSFDFPTGGREVRFAFLEEWINQELIIKVTLVNFTTLLLTYNVQTGILKKIEAVEEDTLYLVGLHTNTLISWESASP